MLELGFALQHSFGLTETQFVVARWILFHIFVVGMLALDLGVFNRKAHAISVKEALAWTGVWVGLSLLFCLGVYYVEGREVALEWITAYTVEKSLSVDNIFVFILIFAYFGIPAEDQHRVLYWGILGAVVMRAILICFGVSIVNRFNWVMIIFGLFLIYSGIKIAIQKDGDLDPESNPVLRLARKYLRVTDKFDKHHFFTNIDGKSFATPLFIVLLVIESSDLLFALDSIPAVIAISKEAFIVYTSNIMAILGLRALYFAMAGIMGGFRFLKYGLAVVLAFIGFKMCAETLDHFIDPAVNNWNLPIETSLTIILITIVTSIVASLVIKEKKPVADTKANN